MKRKISLFITIVMLFSLCSCKRMPEGNLSGIPGTEADTVENDSEKKAEDNNDSEKESTANVDDTEEADIKQEKSDSSSDKQNKDTEKTDDIVSEPEDGGEIENDSQSNEAEDSETVPYLPVELGYVKIVDNNGTKQYVAQKDNFIVEFPVTEEIAAKALKETNKEYRQTNFFCNSDLDFGIFKNLEELEEVMAQQNCIIVKGEFLPEHGTSVVEYEKREMNENVNADYFVENPYTRYNFKVEKIYTPCEEFDVGDIIPVMKYGTIVQQRGGTYLATESIIMKYRDFSVCSPEERTFVLALNKSNFDKRGGYSNGVLFLNAYENVQDGTGDKDQQIAYDILQKYN